MQILGKTQVHSKGHDHLMAGYVSRATSISGYCGRCKSFQPQAHHDAVTAIVQERNLKYKAVRNARRHPHYFKVLLKGFKLASRPCNPRQSAAVMFTLIGRAGESIEGKGPR